MVNERHPDVLFLDVEMPDMSGLDFLEQIDCDNGECDVVMCTAYDDYMLPSFRGNAFDFLLKPVDPKELDIVIQRLTVNKEKKRRLQQTAGDNVRKTRRRTLSVLHQRHRLPPGTHQRHRTLPI